MLTGLSRNALIFLNLLINIARIIGGMKDAVNLSKVSFRGRMTTYERTIALCRPDQF